MDETIFLKECYILGTNHYDALDCWEELKIGVSLDLNYEEGKIYLYHSQYKNKIGYLSDVDAMGLIPYMKADQADIYNSCISYQDKEGKADENTRLKVVIRINKRKNKEREMASKMMVW